MYATGASAMFVLAVPYFGLLSFGSPVLLVVALIVGFSVIWSMYGVILGTLFAESFSANVRSTGVSLGYQVGAALVGGPAPLVATALIVAYDGNYVPVGISIMACAVVSLSAISFLRDRSAMDPDAADPAPTSTSGRRSS